MELSVGSSSAAGGGGRTLRERVLQLPDGYIGSVEKRTQKLWVYERNSMAHRDVTYVPGLHKIFDEVLLYAADNKRRDPNMNALRVEIDVAGCCISVYYHGEGIPVDLHPEDGVYMPELVFGHLPAGSDFDGNVTGVKLANIFSTEFVVEIADGHRMLKYKQVFSENMGKKSEPQITVCEQGENWTRVTFKPDLAKFNLTHLEDDVVALMRKRVVDMAAILDHTMWVVLDGMTMPVQNFQYYMNLYIESAARERGKQLPRVYEKVNDQWEVCVSLSDGQFQQVSFVNGMATIGGGTHVDYVADQITPYLMNILNMKMKKSKMAVGNVKDYLWIFVNALVDNPSFNSKTKETLTTPQGSFGSNCEFSDLFLRKVFNTGAVRDMLLKENYKSRPSKERCKQLPYNKR